MNCENSRDRIPAYLEGTIDKLEAQELEAHLMNCSDCRKVLEETRTLLAAISGTREAEPPASSRSHFLEMLEREKTTGGRHVVMTSLPSQRVLLRYAAAAALVMAGFVGGWLISRDEGSHEEMAALTQEMQNMKQLVMVSILKDASASDRIMAVSYSDQFSNPSRQTIETLVHTLNFDESPNVRMAAAKALRRFSGMEQVRLDLINSFQYQTDPLVQITLIDIMVEMNEKRALKMLQQLMKDESVNPTVRKEAEIGTGLIL